MNTSQTIHATHAHQMARIRGRWGAIYQFLRQVIRTRNFWIAVFQWILILTIVGILISMWIKITKSKKEPKWCYVNYVVAPAPVRADFKTIASAISASPSNGETRFCIYIKKGIYYENIIIPHHKTNLIFLGDGKFNTIIVSNQSTTSNLGTNPFPTLAIRGIGFMARDLTIKMGSGHTTQINQGTVVENLADKTVFYNCIIEGSHFSTLTAYHGRQLYHSCKIEGNHYLAVGNAKAMFQHCEISAAKPAEKRKEVVVSGQMRWKEDEAFIFVFHVCNIHSEAKGGKTYSGAPMAAYSRTVVMQSFLDASVSGWLVNDSSTKTVYFAEFGNYGPGAKPRTNVSNFLSLTRFTASKFTVREVLLDGINWLPSDVPYDLDLV